MRGMEWKTLALATVAAVGLAACGGDDGADEGAEMGGTEQQTEQTQPAETGTQGGQQMANLPEGVTQEQYNQGRQLFTGQGGCQACHGPDATGTQLAPDLTDDEWINVSGRNYDEIVQLIHDGVQNPVQHPSPMPPMGGANLSDEQVDALAAYVVGLGS